MNRYLILFILAALGALSLLARPGAAQLGEPRWQKEFPDSVSWFARTSPGILLVRAGRSLTALDPLDGRQLWSFTDVEFVGHTRLLSRPPSGRASNILEVPGTGVLLLNRAKFPGDSQGHLVAFNLTTGERLWELPQIENLTKAIPLAGTTQAVLVSTLLQTAMDALERTSFILSDSSLWPGYEFHFEFRRIDALTGKIVWTSEFKKIFFPGEFEVNALGDQLVVYVQNRVIGSFSLADGSHLWQEGQLGQRDNRLPRLPLLRANGHLVYVKKNVRAVDGATKQLVWEIRDLGKVTGIILAGDTVIAVGHSQVAAVDSSTGKQDWRNETYGHSTNLLWDKRSDTILYVDGRGLHGVDRKSGKHLLDAPLLADDPPQFLSFAGSETVVAISRKQVSAYDIHTGKKLFDGGKPDGFFSSYASLASTPLPNEGGGLNLWTVTPAETGGLEGSVKNGLLPPEWQSRIVGLPDSPYGVTDAYETTTDTGDTKIWWIDPESNRKVEITPAGAQHDISLALGMVFVAEGNQVRGTALHSKSP
jgi:outer membrane protein assembly factor BamB